MPRLKPDDKHKKFKKNYKKEKETHLERLATKLLDNQEKMDKLREKKIKGGFLDLF